MKIDSAVIGITWWEVGMVEQGSQSGTVVSMGSVCMEWVFWDRIDSKTCTCSTCSPPVG